MLSDGHTKTFDHITNMNVYGDECKLRKEECINHVAKRIVTALRKLRTDVSKKEGIALGGRGFG